ncbi:MAG: Glycosyl transferase family 2, partial [Candidatus Woesebacteria bacterium GW2011_GWA1_38_8]
LLKTGKNLGFTGGNNVGIRYALDHEADFVWLLNNDTFVDRNVLAFVSAFRDPTVGICGSKIYFAPGREFHYDRYEEKDRGKVLWYAGGLVDWDNMYASHRGVDEVDHGQYDKSVETPFITGCSMMIRREVIDRIGFLDDKYYLYLEDLDFCLRAKKAGFKLLYVPSSILWHVNAGSSARPGNPLHEYYLTRNRLLLGFRYASFRTKVALLREALGFTSSVRRKAVMDWMFGRFGNRFSL